MPKRLVAQFGQIVQFSPKIKNKAEAKERREVEDLEWSALFAAAEKRLRSAKPRRL